MSTQTASVCRPASCRTPRSPRGKGLISFASRKQLLNRGDRCVLTAGGLSALGAVPAHPNLLMRSAVAAHAAVRVRGVGAVLQIFSAACRQGGLQLLGPFLIGPGEPKHPIRGQPRSRSTVRNGWPA